MRIGSRRLLRYAALGSVFVLLAVLAAACGNSANAPLAIFAPSRSADDRPVPPAAAYPTPAPTPIPSPTPVRLNGPVTAGLAANMPEAYATPLLAALAQLESVTAANGVYPVRVLDQPANADTLIQFVPWQFAQFPLAQRVFAVAVPFASVIDAIALEDLTLRWQGRQEGDVLITRADTTMLSAVMGPSRARQVNPERLLDELEAAPGAVAIVPFDELDPRLKTLTVDGVNVLDNRFDPAAYPLALGLDISGDSAPLLLDALQGIVEPWTNRNPAALTTLVMTGVTAITRGTAAAIERNNSLTYPADVISDTLSAADITHVSNEVPFLDDCVVNNTENNLTLCSHTDYWATLEAIGTDIVGLSGNHVNDFGREGARRSLQFYRDNDIPIYGSGLNAEEACRPLLWQHHGNTFAFVAALAFEPSWAWATEDEPGACYYYEHRESLLALIEQLAAETDIVAVELQFEESYDAQPLPRQVTEFRALRAAGADIVTGVQSHVPQAIEPYGAPDPGGAGIIAYGLGNLFFDQMWSWATRTNLIARHTIYEGRLLNTEVLTTVLEDYAQPRWASEDERGEILRRIFAAAPPRPAPADE